MLIVALGVSSAIAWGLADFLGGFKNRELDIWTVGLASQLAALLICAPVLLAAGGPVPEDRVLVYGALAGVANAVGLITFYRALALGRMSIVAPIVGMSALLPVIVGLISGERPSLLQSAGIAIGIGGIVLASRELDHEVGDRAGSRWVILLSVVAAAAVGANLIGIEKAVALSDETSVLWPIAAARASAVVLILAGAVATGRLRAPAARHVTALIALGALDLAANVLYAHATQETLLSVAAVLASLHPVVTILMARLLLDERLRRVQQAGVVLAIAGVCLIAGG
jgi:drug/metabolite transporter (DMT)-like permease